MHRHLKFEEYGVDDYGRRATGQPQDSDPYVEVDPILRGVNEDVGTWMASAAFQREMEAVAGLSWPIPDDFGIARYVRVTRALDAAVTCEFPNLIGM